MITQINIRILEQYTMYGASLCSFWKNISGHFERFPCNHRYAHDLIFMGSIAQTNSLIFLQNSAFL